jgi:dienelactone hydrolase
MHKILMLMMALLTTASTAALAEVKTKEVTYRSGGVSMKGYVAYDDAIKGKRPGVLVVHEWWGNNDYARKRARMLAELGYTALSVDMYGDGKTADHKDDAAALATQVAKDMPVAKARFEAGLKALKKEKSVDGSKVAAIGYCFGGSVVLNMARLGVDLKGVASFHGSLGGLAPAEKDKVKARVAVFTGEADPMVPAEQVTAFKQQMDAAGAKYSVVSYPGVKHSFTNPQADEYAKRFGLPVAYDAKADADSWAQTQIFLKDIFAGK